MPETKSTYHVKQHHIYLSESDIRELLPPITGELWVKHFDKAPDRDDMMVRICLAEIFDD